MKNLIALFSLLAMTTTFAADVDLKRSSLMWKGTKVTGEHFGKISFKSAKVKTAKGKLSSGEFVVNMNAITVDDLSGKWAQKFLGHIKSGDFFEVTKYPTSKLVLKELKGDMAKGDLTIKGITNPVTFKMNQKGNAYTGKLTFDRTKFNMRYKSGNYFKDLGDKVIHDKVNVDFKVVLK